MFKALTREACQTLSACASWHADCGHIVLLSCQSTSLNQCLQICIAKASCIVPIPGKSLRGHYLKITWHQGPLFKNYITMYFISIHRKRYEERYLSIYRDTYEYSEIISRRLDVDRYFISVWTLWIICYFTPLSWWCKNLLTMLVRAILSLYFSFSIQQPPFSFLPGTQFLSFLKSLVSLTNIFIK